MCLELLENIFSLLLITSADLYPEPPLPEDYVEDEDVEGKGHEVCLSPAESPQHMAQPEKKAERAAPCISRSLAYPIPDCLKAESKDPGPRGNSFLDLRHMTRGVTGFLANERALGAFLGLLQEQLDALNSRIPPQKTQPPEGPNCSGSRAGLQGRLQRFSKILSEAQWRFKVVKSNRSSGKQW